MNWLIDLGNTRLKCAALLADGRRGEVQAFAHADIATRGLDALGRAAPGDVVWLASVANVPRTDEVVQALQALGYAVRRVRAMANCDRVRIAYADPARLGVDRFLALVAASRRDDGPWLIVSVGSAVTVDLLATDGQHLGGLISIAPGHQRQALATRFPALDVAGGRARPVFATDTADALASGARAAVIGLVEHGLRAAQRQLGAMPTLVLTGGGADELTDLDVAHRVVVPALVLDGLAIVAREGAA